jgi:hypothetical protein
VRVKTNKPEDEKLGGERDQERKGGPLPKLFG